jgi:hypothetical protein
VASAWADGAPYLVPLSFRLGRRLAADGHSRPGREVDELPERDLMRDGRWLSEGTG